MRLKLRQVAKCACEELGVIWLRDLVSSRSQTQAHAWVRHWSCLAVMMVEHPPVSSEKLLLHLTSGLGLQMSCSSTASQHNA